MPRGSSNRRVDVGRRRMSVLRGLLGPDVQGVRQALAALGISSITSIGAGVALAQITGTLEELPGLLVLVPAAIGMRGNIFGALGSRLSTTIHAGTFRLSRRRDGVVAQNVLAASVLTLLTGVVLGIMARVIASAFAIEGVVSFADLIVVSAIGAILASLVVLVVTLALAGGAARYGWDLDNVNAPLVSAVGDVVTLPALFVGAQLVSIAFLTPSLAVVALLGAVVATVATMRSGLRQLVEIVRESLPVLAASGVLLVIAGVVIEHRLDDFVQYRALLVLVPASLASAGAVGGIFAGRLSSKLHLGVVEPKAVPDRSARLDVQMAVLIALPVFAANGILAHGAAWLFDFATPGAGRLIAVSLVGGMLATASAVVIAYYGTVLALRVGLDPDTYGIPLVTSAVDLIGAAALVLSITWVGLP